MPRRWPQVSYGEHTRWANKGRGVGVRPHLSVKGLQRQVGHRSRILQGIVGITFGLQPVISLVT